MAPTDGQRWSLEATVYFIHHVVLPPKLPQAEDFDASHEQSLLDAVVGALQALQSGVEDSNAKDVIAFGIRTIQSLRNCRDSHGHVSECQLRQALNNLALTSTDGSVALEIRAQNAGLLINRCDQHINFESFELSPSNGAAMSSSGRLIRTFPGSASKIPTSTMQNEAFRDSIAYTIAKMTTQAAIGALPRIQKNGQMVDEDRDTAHPLLVTDWLMNYIAGLGETCSVTQISKNTREEVLWSDCQYPWRRSPLWLLVRVTLHLLFARQGGVEQPFLGLYKAFVVQLVSDILLSAKKHWKTMGSEALYIINSKLARRYRKMENLNHSKLLRPQWLAGIRNSMINAHSLINNEWKALSGESGANVDTTVLQNIQPAQDLDVALPRLDKFLTEVAARCRDTHRVEFEPSVEFPMFPADELPVDFDTSGEYEYFYLAALEIWVEQHLSSWLSAHIHNQTTCGRLRSLIKDYHYMASDVYLNLPHSLSHMYLTILELWVACDTSACKIYPLLLQYDPELDLDDCQCLILPLKSQMERLIAVERYLHSRKLGVVKSCKSIFRHFGHDSTFAVRYFDQSTELQTLYSDIKSDATDQKRRKLNQLADTKRQYDALMHRYNNLECETQDVIVDHYHRYTETVHSPHCTRCKSKRKADALNIHIFEWPLSSDECIAKATVFELRIPQAFSDWRDASIHLIASVLRHRNAQAVRPYKEYTLEDHHELSKHLSSRYPDRRIILVSSIKSHTDTHRKLKKAIPLIEDDDVCPPNALRYEYFDDSLGVFTEACNSEEELAEDCTYQMPSTQSEALERFLYRPPSAADGVSSNKVIASLSDCPTHFSLDEYKAFGMLPFGREIVYYNILIQLVAPTIDFSKVETQILILQIVGQAGVPGDNGNPGRVTHHILENTAFAHAMLEQLEISQHRVSENWESWRALSTFVVLCRRILSLTLSPQVQQRSLEMLHQARHISMKWLDRLKQRANTAADNRHRDDLYSIATEIALLCVSTFDVDDTFVETILQEQSAISILLQCSITIQENYEFVQPESRSVYKSMLQSWRSLLYRACATTRQHILLDNTGLNEAVLANWAAFRSPAEGQWNTFSNAHEHWLYNQSGSLNVYFNLLTGELLVDGRPLARLPAKFTNHTFYPPLFKSCILEVVPSDKPGMRFSARSTYRDHELHFGMGGSDMYVIAVKDHCTMDLLPPRLFEDQIPHSFVEGYIHWYDHNRDEVIFRPREDPWSSSGAEWRLLRDGLAWRLVNGSNTLTNMTSKTARALSKIFSSVEEEQHIHTILDTSTSCVLISLPRLQLNFVLESNDDKIRSSQYCNMFVDPEQTTEVLVGLTSKLVLVSVDPLEHRLILIPAPRTFGPDVVTYKRASGQHHMLVTIDKEQAHGVYTYALDTTLGRILDSGDVQRKLFLVLLHAVTSHCLPDLLTGYTGTESALRILQSAALRSFEYLTSENVKLLSYIAALSPVRDFYPPYLMDMQQVRWNPTLPVLSQHPQLRTNAKEIIHHAQRMRLFYPNNVPDISHWESSNPHLDARDAIRSSTFRVCSFGAEQFTSEKDSVYAARDVHPCSERGYRAYIAVTLIVRDQAAICTPIPNLEDIFLRTHFKDATIQGSSSEFDPASLRFDSKWLLNSSSVLRNNWCNLHRTLPGASASSNRYDTGSWLSVMAFAESADMIAIQTLAAFYRLRDLANMTLPSLPVFDLAQGYILQPHEIYGPARRFLRSFDLSDEARSPEQDFETTDQHHTRVRALFQRGTDEAVAEFVANLKKQWPCAIPNRPTSSSINKYMDTYAAMHYIEKKYEVWFSNRLFLGYLQQLSTIMARQTVVTISSPHRDTVIPLAQCCVTDAERMVSLNDVFAMEPPVISPDIIAARRSSSTPSLLCALGIPIKQKDTPEQEDEAKSRLGQLCGSLQTLARSKCEKDYVDNLRASCASLENTQGQSLEFPTQWSASHAHSVLQEHLDACTEYLDGLSITLAQVVTSQGSLGKYTGSNVQHSPRISPTFWLSQLHRDRYTNLSEEWKNAMIEYGLAITDVHRARRLIAMSTRPADLLEELSHVGHSNWQPKEFPETLLLEAESGILVRKEQEFIASHMRDPNEETNIVLQLLMGGGKSSVIIPMVAAYLTDKTMYVQTREHVQVLHELTILLTRLVRIIVAKPQSKQMLHTLVAKLGQLLNRRVYHMPYSRTIRPTASDACLIREIYEECRLNRGVLLVQPEHILSFKLMAVESTLIGHACAPSLQDTLHFFDTTSRDIVDESDENFSVKFELIYTMGSQQSIELAPERWLIIAAIVGLVPRFASLVKETHPDGIEIQGCVDGRFPRIRLFGSDASDQLFKLIANHIIEYGTIGLATNTQPEHIQAALLRYITQTDLTTEDVQAVEESKFWTTANQSSVLLVRGLLAGGILRFALSTKRWRVNFGLDPNPNRTPKTQLAVPFRSKDSPSPRSEFSHPDVVILLSLLCYYYGGLTDKQLLDSFTHLQKSDQAAIQYEDWVDSASSHLPTAFRQLSGVSVKDQHQCRTEIFPYLRYSKKAIDYFLSFLVFPKAMREFPQKLSSSGWDIGAIKSNPLTGFSGTNDTLHLLPLTVKHLDLPSQKHTDALVLQYLLQDENSVELLPSRRSGTDAAHILSVIVGMVPEVRVLLDCGAAILEQNNQQVATAWLNMRDEAIQAVVFFDDEELSIVDRAGRVEPFQTSPFARQLNVCLVYLDEAHTRGTDLKLPRNYRAGVTLGQALTKDTLTQGCMRMRKLGFGQSVAFIVPDEISKQIREQSQKTSVDPINVTDVLCWCVGETWQDLKRSMPLWAIQGERFERNKALFRGTTTTQEQAQAFLETETQNLQVRYKPSTQENCETRFMRKWDSTNPSIAQIVKRCQEFDALGFGAASLSEEQERELAPEIEQERQVERLPRMFALKHHLHPDVGYLVGTGKLLRNSKAFIPAFQALASTSAARLFPVANFPTDLLVTADFMHTVEISTSSAVARSVSDSYQRPVQFVLSIPSSDRPGTIQNLVLISPFEANCLLPEIRKEAKVTLHLFSPRINPAYAPLDKLDVYTIGLAFSADRIPQSLTMQLNLFAGSLYLRSFDEYTEFCDCLGLLRSKPREGQQVHPDGFIDPPVGKWGLQTSPVPFLRSLLLTIRRDGEGAEKAHLGKILSGLRLQEADFRERPSSPSGGR